MFQIQTALGTRNILRRVGIQGEYYQEASSPSSPHGGWWLLNPQKGFVPVPSNSPALLAALEES